MRIVVLISNTGTGTNLKAIIEGIKSGRIKGEIVAVVSDKEDALGLQHAKENKLNIEICQKKEDLLSLLVKLSPDYICLAGWKQIVTDDVILAYQNKILNLHPGLISESKDGKSFNPDGTEAIWNKGMLTDKAISNFLSQKSTYAGSSIHFLTLEFDFGPVLGRTFEKIRSGDTVDTLYERLKKKENELYVEVLEKLTSNE
jgi:phosphoribosylglycinamide formyltransferase-1